jgi:hypothetical protein
MIALGKKCVLVLVLVGFTLGAGAFAAPLSESEVLERAESWMGGHPLMGPAGRTVASLEVFPEDDAEHSVYIVRLSPAGYLVLNTDDAFPLVVGYSADSTVDLSENPDNAFRVMLEQYVETMEDAPLSVSAGINAVTAEEEDATELIGPLLETTWNQCNPYNLYCPDAPEGGSEQYGYRVPVGCVMTAYAQVMQFHRWPVHGVGSKNHVDSFGSCTGTYSADFSDAYDWASMEMSYNPWNVESDPSKDAIAALMYELGIATGANYETDGTSANSADMGTQLTEYFYFEETVHYASYEAVMGPMEAEIRAGYPCVVSVPGHAIVADGLMVNAGEMSFHINYGWGGSNNGWWSADNVAGSALSDGVVNIRPRLIPFSTTSSVTLGENESGLLEWILPKRREAEAELLTLYLYNNDRWSTWVEDCELAAIRYSAVDADWDDCADFSIFEVTSTSSVNDWDISTTSGVDHCFFKPGGGYSNREYHLTATSTITPTDSTWLTLSAKYSLASDGFRVLVSTDGVAFSEIWAAEGTVDWSDLAMDLSAYAGQPIYIRLEYTAGSYYADGGVWIDSVGTREVTHPELKGQALHYTLIEGLNAGTYTVAAALTDTNGVEHSTGPSFELVVVGDGDLMPRDWELENGLDPALNDGALDPDHDGFSNYQEYICGTIPTNAASVWRLETGDGVLPHFQGIEERWYTIEFCDDLSLGWETLEGDIPGTNGPFSVADYDAPTHAARFYRVKVSP